VIIAMLKEKEVKKASEPEDKQKPEQEGLRIHTGCVCNINAAIHALIALAKYLSLRMIMSFGGLS
jgi:hypothetical protein